MAPKRMRNPQQKHGFYLDELVKNLRQVGEEPRDISWIIAEGIWLKERSCMYNSLCDLIVGYEGFSVNLLELKGSKKKRQKALLQLGSGVDFVKNHFPTYTIKELKIVYYTGGQYEYESFNQRGNRLRA